MEINHKKMAFNPEEYENEHDILAAIELCLKNFILSNDENDMAFPSSLTKKHRKFVHDFAGAHNLKTRSRMKGPQRFVTVFLKSSKSFKSQERCKVELDESSRNMISTLLQKYPVTNKERQELLPPTERRKNFEVSEGPSNSFGQLVSGKPQVPNLPGKSDISEEAKKLPVWAHKDDIISGVSGNQVVLVCGETGSGKTTQIPQMVLEEAAALKKPCKVLCTQPRRISAISVAERVSAERGEKLGGTIGYQIKLEGRTSSKTLLTFCTTGIVLRALMAKSDVLSAVTHIFVDEVHERDKLMDFLLIALRDSLPSHRNLKVILMSANLDVELYSKYFNNCPIVKVPVKSYPVKQYFLEDVLEFTNYRTERMLDIVDRLKKDQYKNNSLLQPDRKNSENNQEHTNGTTKQTEPERCCSPSTMNQLDEYLEEAFLTGSDDCFANILYFIMSENVSPDYQHSINGTTPLMVAAGRGRTDIIGVLFSLNASLNLKSTNGWTASEWATSTNQSQALDMLDQHKRVKTENQLGDLSCNDDTTISAEKKMLAYAYTNSFSDHDIDKDLIFATISHIHSREPQGGILVFLSGYEDIISMMDRILADEKIFNGGRNISIFCLHSSMASSDQKRVFHNVPSGMRKIVLSTNIAETSVTINDIVYIVDCGMHKQMTYDAFTSLSSLRTTRISQASVAQRKGRAGRCQPGVAYHLMSEDTFRRMEYFQTPEILRTPLQDLCLHSKLLSLPNVSIADFLSKAPQAPSSVAVNKAVHLLKKMDALDEWEDATELGHHLLDVSLPPHLGKMVLVACILKCLDPVVIIAAFLSYKDPFILPIKTQERLQARESRKKFSNNIFSDHYLLLSVYQGYEKACKNNSQKKWCAEYFISTSTMELISRSRLQILAQLRHSGFLKVVGSTDLRDANVNSDNWSVVKAAILSGVYPRILKLDRNRKEFQVESYNKLRLHRGCILMEAFSGSSVAAYKNTMKKICSAVQSDWFFYDELGSSALQAIVRKVTSVTPLSVLLFCGPMRLPLDALSQPKPKVQGSADDEESDDEGCDVTDTSCSIMLDSFVQFAGDQTTSCLLLQLRYKIQSFIQRKLKSPFKAVTSVDDEIIMVLASLLKKEDQALGLLPTDDRPPINNRLSHPQSSYVRITPNSRHSGKEFDSKSHPIDGRQRDGDYKSKPKYEVNSGVTTTNTITLSASKPVACSEPPVKSDGLQSVKDSCRKDTDSTQYKIDTKYFIVKFPSFRLIEIAHNLGTVTFSAGTERKLLHEVQKQPVTLIFALNRGKQFFGYAKFNGRLSERRHHPEFSNLDMHNQVFKIHLLRSDVFFHQTRHLLNPYNENLQIHMCRDGQEVDRTVGEQLVKILDRSIVPSAGAAPYMNDASNPPRRPFMPHYAPRPPPFMPPHPGHRPDFAGPYTRPFRGYGFGGGFRGVHRGFRRGMGHS